MDTIALSKHYATLNPWERFKLCAAAAGRGDTVEVDRLARSAPHLSWNLSHHWGLWDGLRDVMTMYPCEQLSATALLWEASFILQQPPTGAENPQHLTFLRDLVTQLIRLVAYGVAARADAWKLFCTELHLDGVTLLGCFPGYGQLQAITKFAKSLAFSVEEAQAFLRRLSTCDPSVAAKVIARARTISLQTAEEIAADMRKCLEDRLDQWS